MQLTVVDSLLAVKHLVEYPFPRDIGSVQLSCTAPLQPPTPRLDAEARTLFPFGVAEFVRRAIGESPLNPSNVPHPPTPTSAPPTHLPVGR